MGSLVGMVLKDHLVFQEGSGLPDNLVTKDSPERSVQLGLLVGMGHLAILVATVIQV